MKLRVLPVPIMKLFEILFTLETHPKILVFHILSDEIVACAVLQ